MGRETNRNLRNRRRKQAMKKMLRLQRKQRKKTTLASAKARTPAATP
jgi:hypothetical protein